MHINSVPDSFHRCNNITPHNEKNLSSFDVQFHLNIIDIVLFEQFVAIYFMFVSSMNIKEILLDETL